MSYWESILFENSESPNIDNDAIYTVTFGSPKLKALLDKLCYSTKLNYNNIILNKVTLYKCYSPNITIIVNTHNKREKSVLQLLKLILHVL